MKITSASDTIFRKESATWVDHSTHPDCGCTLMKMKQLHPDAPIQAWMIDHRPHGGRVRWKVTDQGVTKDQGKSRNRFLAEKDILKVYDRVQSEGIAHDHQTE